MTERRWLAGLAKAAADEKTQMPWTRGPRRAAWIAKRAEAAGPAPKQARA